MALLYISGSRECNKARVYSKNLFKHVQKQQ